MTNWLQLNECRAEHVLSRTIVSCTAVVERSVNCNPRAHDSQSPSYPRGAVKLSQATLQIGRLTPDDVYGSSRRVIFIGEHNKMPIPRNYEKVIVCIIVHHLSIFGEHIITTHNFNQFENQPYLWQKTQNISSDFFSQLSAILIVFESKISPRVERLWRLWVKFSG